MPIQDEDNPLYGREWRGGRQSRKYQYTLDDIAVLVGYSVRTVRNDTYKKILDAGSLASVVKYVLERRKRDL